VTVLPANLVKTVLPVSLVTPPKSLVTVTIANVVVEAAEDVDVAAEDADTGVILLVNLAMTKKMLKKQLRLLFSDET